MASFATERAEATKETPESLGRFLGVPNLLAQYILAMRAEIGELRGVIQEQAINNDCLNLSLHEQDRRIAALESRSENGKPVPRHRGGTPKERAVLSH